MFQNNKGFTMIEVLLAITLIGIALIPIMQVMPQFYRTNRDMINENTLSFLAQQKIEEVKGKLSNPGHFGDSITSSGSFSGFTGADSYQFSITGPTIDGSRTNLKVVTVKVWYGSVGSSYDAAKSKIQLKTKIASRT